MSYSAAGNCYQAINEKDCERDSTSCFQTGAIKGIIFEQ